MPVTAMDTMELQDHVAVEISAAVRRDAIMINHVPTTAMDTMELQDRVAVEISAAVQRPDRWPYMPMCIPINQFNFRHLSQRLE